jgi:CheY-like chemotaxis protein
MGWSSSEWAASHEPGGAPGPGPKNWRSGGADLLVNARILVVEDEMLVAALLEDRLAALGCRVIGPATAVADALELLKTEEVDAAVLDVNIGGEKVFPVADALAARNIPFLFATAYGAGGVVEPHNRRDVLDKPYQARALEHALRSALQSRQRH